jgi:hypothetical protein
MLAPVGRAKLFRTPDGRGTSFTKKIRSSRREKALIFRWGARFDFTEAAGNKGAVLFAAGLGMDF